MYKKGMDSFIYNIAFVQSDMADADYERVLCVKNEVFVYRIPARTSNRGYR